MIGIAEVVRFLASHPYSAATCETYRRILVEVVKLDDLADLDAAGLVQFVQSHSHWGNSQQWVALCACRKFLAWQFGASHPALSARIKRIRSRRQRTLTVASASDLLASFDTSSPKGCRDLALCALGLDTGLRCSEFCRLKLVDVDLSAHNLQVIVKGGQWGTGIYSVQTAQYLIAWLAFRSVSWMALMPHSNPAGSGSSVSAGSCPVDDAVPLAGPNDVAQPTTQIQKQPTTQNANRMSSSWRDRGSATTPGRIIFTVHAHGGLL